MMDVGYKRHSRRQYLPHGHAEARKVGKDTLRKKRAAWCLLTCAVLPLWYARWRDAKQGGSYAARRDCLGERSA